MRQRIAIEAGPGELARLELRLGDEPQHGHSEGRDRYGRDTLDRASDAAMDYLEGGDHG